MIYTMVIVMVEVNGVVPQAQSSKESSEWNQQRKNYVPWFEQLPIEALRFHTKEIHRQAELDRPNLTVVEFGPGHPESYLSRALHVVNNGGQYYAFDNDKKLVDDGNYAANTKRKIEVFPRERLHIEEFNGNKIIDASLENTANVVIISSPDAAATVAEAHEMRRALQERLQQAGENNSNAIYYDFCANFLAKILKDRPIENELPRAYMNVLLLINALLVLKDGGRLVYAQQDDTGTNSRVSFAGDLCGHLGFVGERRDWFESPRTVQSGVVHNPKYNLLATDATRRPLVIAEKDRSKLNRPLEGIAS